MACHCTRNRPDKFFPSKFPIQPNRLRSRNTCLPARQQQSLMERIQSKLHPDICPRRKLEGYLSPQGNIVKEKQLFYNGVYASWKTKRRTSGGYESAGLFQLTPKGINRYSVTCFKHQPNNPYSISDNSIYSIFQDSHNRIWIGCYGGGLNLLIRRNDQTPIFIHSNNELKNSSHGYGMKVRNITERSRAAYLW